MHWRENWDFLLEDLFQKIMDMGIHLHKEGPLKKYPK